MEKFILESKENLKNKFLDKKINKLNFLFINKKFIYICKLFLTIYFIASIAIFLLFYKNKGYTIASISCIIWFIFFILFTIIQNNTKRKFKDLISNKNYLDIYKNILQNKIKNLEIKEAELKNEINDNNIYKEIFHKKYNKNSKSNYEYKKLNNIVLSINNWNIELGTIILHSYKKNKHIFNTIFQYNSNEIYYSNNYFIINNIKCPYINNLIRVDKKKLSKNEQRLGLESKEFELMYDIKYDDPIEVRKFFKPKMMLDCTIQGQKSSYFESIYMEKNRFKTISKMKINPQYNKENYIFYFDFMKSIDYTVDLIFKNIEKDINYIIHMLTWLKILKIN